MPALKFSYATKQKLKRSPMSVYDFAAEGVNPAVATLTIASSSERWESNSINRLGPAGRAEKYQAKLKYVTSASTRKRLTDTDVAVTVTLTNNGTTTEITDVVDILASLIEDTGDTKLTKGKTKVAAAKKAPAAKVAVKKTPAAKKTSAKKAPIKKTAAKSK